MKRINVLTAFSVAAILTVSVMSGCSDNNGGYSDIRPTDTVTTSVDIVERTTKVQESDITTTEKDSSQTTTAKADTESNDTTTTTAVFGSDDGTYVEYHFRSKKQLNQHFEKHGAEFEDDFDYNTPEEYEKGASDVINNDEALYKTEAEDGDGVYYIEATNEFVILSTDGYIRTYFRPNGGKSYYDRQ